MKNEEKTPLDMNKKVRGFGSGNTFQRDDFDGMSKSLNTLQVKFDSREGNKAGQFLEYLQVTTAYLITNLKGGGGIETIRKIFRDGVAGPDQTHTSGHEGHVTGGVRNEGEESVETMHQPEHGIWPSSQSVHRLPTVTSQMEEEVGDDIQRLGPDRSNKKS